MMHDRFNIIGANSQKPLSNNSHRILKLSFCDLICHRRPILTQFYKIRQNSAPILRQFCFNSLSILPQFIPVTFLNSLTSYSLLLFVRFTEKSSAVTKLASNASLPVSKVMPDASKKAPVRDRLKQNTLRI